MWKPGDPIPGLGVPGIDGIAEFDDEALFDSARDRDGKLPPNHTAPRMGRCYESHPIFMIPCAEGEMVGIYGGSCISPVIKGADVYVGFDSSMTYGRAMPWDGGVEILYKIQDRGVPKDIVLFKKLVAWVAEQLLGGKTVHAGCIGGHGRTGLFL